MPKDVFIDPFTDFGFKKLFGEEESKEALIDFLNQFLPTHDQIHSLEYGKNEHLPRTEEDRIAIFDLLCTNQDNKKFIIELQRAKQTFLVDRSIYYLSFLLQEQGKKGPDWNYELQTVYSINILQFQLKEKAFSKRQLIHYAQIRHSISGRPITDKINFIYLEVPKFNKSLDELQSRQDKWLFLLKNLAKLDKRPPALRDRVFQRFFERAKIAKLPPKEARNYQMNLEKMGDYKNTIQHAKNEAREEGREEGRVENQILTAQNMYSKGFDYKTIADILNVKEREVKKWLKSKG
ncbi:Rpn family recombination-promoting nuclease/putative transposase [Persicobacter sp. CCB-QB2]|uniref:Rpn family recombination-promoting nuclease/putative transposase n=1 Tax=Persicobacter sp. CCB-QB2 TaxID=1561025 RepID=UPI0006A9F085|nr:Rpn family recombination-promoting nuclease/putative transposase [Persicobacter sp. CCB-QB2]